jgi:hypothetical protein
MWVTRLTVMLEGKGEEDAMVGEAKRKGIGWYWRG